MRNLFGINKGGESTFQKFISNELSTDNKNYLWEARARVEDARNKAVPKWLLIIASVLSIAFVIMLALLFDEWVSTKYLWENHPYLFYIDGAGIVVSVVLWVVIAYRYRKLYNNSEFKAMENSASNRATASKMELGVPCTSVKVDVLFPKVKYNEDGTEKKRNIALSTLANIEHDVYVEKDNLCIAEYEYVVSIPLDSIKSITKVKKWVTLATWNKAEPITNHIYKPYKLFYSQQGIDDRIMMKWHYVMLMEIDGEEWQMLIPNYDIDAFKKLVPVAITDPYEKTKN